MRAQPRLARGPAHSLYRAVVFGIARHGGEMQIAIGFKHVGETGDKRLVDAVELIRPLGQVACL